MQLLWIYSHNTHSFCSFDLATLHCIINKEGYARFNDLRLHCSHTLLPTHSNSFILDWMRFVLNLWLSAKQVLLLFCTLCEWVCLQSPKGKKKISSRVGTLCSLVVIDCKILIYAAVLRERRQGGEMRLWPGHLGNHSQAFTITGKLVQHLRAGPKITDSYRCVMWSSLKIELG